MLPSVRINRKAADRLASGHPWIFSSDVIDRGEANAGDAVKVVDAKGRILGTAVYSSTSQITLRQISRKVEEVDESFLRRRLEAAIAFRRQVVRDSDSYRVVFGEADQLPGLVVDRYADCLVVQLLNQAMDRRRALIVELLRQLLEPVAIVLRNDVSVRQLESLPQHKEVVYGSLPDEVLLHMNGFTWRADLFQGQKTGVFLDQRENYAAAARYGQGHALDCFTCTGGFAIHLASHCDTVEAVDSSAESLKTAQANRDANGIRNIEFKQADVFDLLSSYTQARRQFSTIVLDPPAFTKTRDAREGALRGYREINQRALRMLSPGGILVTCSCSHHVSEAMLLEVVAGAALDAGKTLRVIERRTQASDHPILLTVPETLYLKCLILQVAG